MRSLERNKQKMYYSLRGKQNPVYEKDDDENIIYIKDSKGNNIPLETGEYELSYGSPTEFSANVNSKLHEALVRAFGTDDSSDYAQIVSEKGAFSFNIGTRIWRDSAIKYKDEEETAVDVSSADYEVRGVLTEGLNEDMFYLKVLNHEDENEDETVEDETTGNDTVDYEQSEGD